MRIATLQAGFLFYGNMKIKFTTLLVLLLSLVLNTEAQTYLDNLQKKAEGQGNITVVQDKEISDLVNGKLPLAEKAAKPEQQDYKKAATTTIPFTVRKDTAEKKKHVAEKKETTIIKETIKKETATNQNKETNAAERNSHETIKAEEDFDIPTVDLRKKVMLQSHKANGYRVQVFSGGNSRNDRLKAEQIGNNVKMSFPNQPVYVHFYSPRWICRMGNYRSIGEADKMLKKVRALGYKQACIVRGKITVQY
jgi:hypothetical protein